MMFLNNITAIVGHPQENVDFYAGVLGLRLVKKTVNFDDPETYHLYFGNEGGKPGTIITFFPWPNAYKGKNGGGQVGTTTYVVPVGALSFWENRLAKFKIPYTKTERFGEQYLSFDDPHGLHLELVARESGEVNTWSIGEVTPEVAIKGFGGAVLHSTRPTQTAQTLENVMGLEKIGEEGTILGIAKALRGQQRRRLMDLGIVPGTKIEAELESLTGDPVAYKVRGTTVALRKQQTDKIYLVNEESN